MFAFQIKRGNESKRRGENECEMTPFHEKIFGGSFMSKSKFM